MSRLSEFIVRGRMDLPVYITDVRDDFLSSEGDGVTLALTKFGGGIRRIALRIPASECKNEHERAFVRDYVYAEVHNLLSSLGGERLDIYTSSAGSELLRELPAAFGVSLPRKERPGYGRSINVIERMLDSLGTGKAFEVCIHETQAPPVAVESEKACGDFIERFAAALEGNESKLLCGVDVGGTDIKLCTSVYGKLSYLKEYDWFPALFTRSSQLIDPILLLTRLLRARVSCELAGIEAVELDCVINNHTSDSEIEKAVVNAEAALGDKLVAFDSIGLCFPDVVIGNKIVGGEVFKTRGIRNNPDIEYESEFRKLTDLCDMLGEYAERVRIINDGPMAAFTAAMELIGEGMGGLLRDGRFAHTLGTELGTGWITENGEIPEIPLEVYNFIIDLGSFEARKYHPDDLRSILNFNTGLPGTLQKFMAQNGVFRMALKASLDGDGKLYGDLLAGGYIEERDGGVFVSLEPKDMRKPLLEYLMKLCANGSHELTEVFLEIGRSTGITFRETEHILAPRTKDRILYGRLVKVPRCFELIKSGASEIDETLRLSVADEQNAFTKLMLQLKEHSVYTVPQFAQAVGALYFGRL